MCAYPPAPCRRPEDGISLTPDQDYKIRGAAMRAAVFKEMSKPLVIETSARSRARPDRHHPQGQELRHLRIGSAHDRTDIGHAAGARLGHGPRIRRRSRGRRQGCGRTLEGWRSRGGLSLHLLRRSQPLHQFRARARGSCAKGISVGLGQSHGAYAEYRAHRRQRRLSACPTASPSRRARWSSRWRWGCMPSTWRRWSAAPRCW